MATYAKKTCSVCGIIDIQPNMHQIEVERQAGRSQGGVSKRTIIGALFGNKESSRAMKRKIFNSSKRTYHSKKKVWVCAKCKKNHRSASRFLSKFLKSLFIISIVLIWVSITGGIRSNIAGCWGKIKDARVNQASNSVAAVAKHISVNPIYTRVEISTLFGKHHTDLSTVFTGLPETEAGRMTTLNGWGGWQTVCLGFNDAGCLVLINFTPTEPLTEVEAKQIIEETYGVPLPSSERKRTPAFIAYSDMNGPVKSVKFNFLDSEVQNGHIGEIEIFANTH